MKALTEFTRFLQDVRREIDPKTGRVTWPGFKNIRISTVVVMISSVILAFYIAACDYLLRGIFTFTRTVG